MPISVALRQSPHNQGCNGGELATLATCFFEINTVFIICYYKGIGYFNATTFTNSLTNVYPLIVLPSFKSIL